MHLHPSREEFTLMSQQGNLIPVYAEILADMETPVSAFRKINEGAYAYLLESVEMGEHWGRYSLLGARPGVVFKCRNRQVEVTRNGCTVTHEASGNPLLVLRELMSRYKPVSVPGLPAFFGGAVGYMGYDVVRFFEELPRRSLNDLDLPDAVFIITDTILIFDHIAQTIKVVCNVHLDGNLSPETAYDQAAAQIEAVIDRLRRPESCEDLLDATIKNSPVEFDSNLTREEFIQAVKRAKEYIRAGDAFQIVLSQRFSHMVTGEPFNIYRALRRINPSPYMFFLKLDDVTLVGASPELLVMAEGEEVKVRPIAGTRPRGKTPDEDKRLEEELKQDEKERAEHLMLVDLGRNDIGRISSLGSVRVSDFMRVERYSHVMHIVSDVEGKVSPGQDWFDILAACFPAGTVSGAPKIRAMEIIEELEPTRRGTYAGAVGYISFSRNMQTCITIRTILIKDGRAYVQAGAGIVADSVPENEYQETLNKARAMFVALEMVK